jgi:hypothetical protein
MTPAEQSTEDKRIRDMVVCDGHQELRDIVIETRTDVRYIKESIDRLNHCLGETEQRVSYLELNGANISRQNAADLKVLDKKVDKIEKTCLTADVEHKVEKSWVDNTYAKIGIVGGLAASIVFGILGYFK